MFPDEFFPELLGMTLYLEWEATPTLTPHVRMLRNRSINPHFYSLHVAIDNVAAGHGALAKEAVKLYLDQVRKNGGDREMNAQWERIWNGYVTWATEGTFGRDLYQYLREFDGKVTQDEKKKIAEDRMEALIRQKAPYARTAHGPRRLGGSLLNSLFDEPRKLMSLLLKSRWVNLDSPRDSPIFTELTSFLGPMYKVFTSQDQDVILDWLETQQSAPDDPAPSPSSDVGQLVRAIFEEKQPFASAAVAHDDYSLPDGTGGTKSVREWFAGPVEEVMAALARSEYIHPGSVEESQFFGLATALMQSVFTEEEVETLRTWVRASCPVPGQAVDARGRVNWENAPLIEYFSGRRNLQARSDVPFGIVRQLIGAGTVH
jgi:hypothetical protein